MRGDGGGLATSRHLTANFIKAQALHLSESLNFNTPGNPSILRNVLQGWRRDSYGRLVDLDTEIVGVSPSSLAAVG